MIGEWIRFLFAALFVISGAVILIISLIGLFRFKFALNRIHAAAMTDTLALGLFLIGILISVGWDAVVWKLILVLVMQWCTSPLSSHMLAKFEYLTNPEISDYLELPEEAQKP